MTAIHKKAAKALSATWDAIIGVLLFPLLVVVPIITFLWMMCIALYSAARHVIASRLSDTFTTVAVFLGMILGGALFILVIGGAFWLLAALLGLNISTECIPTRYIDC